MSIEDQLAFLRLARSTTLSEVFDLKHFVKTADVPASMMVVAMVSLIDRGLIKGIGKMKYQFTQAGLEESAPWCLDDD